MSSDGGLESGRSAHLAVGTLGLVRELCCVFGALGWMSNEHFSQLNVNTCLSLSQLFGVTHMCPVLLTGPLEAGQR